MLRTVWSKLLKKERQILRMMRPLGCFGAKILLVSRDNRLPCEFFGFRVKRKHFLEFALPHHGTFHQCVELFAGQDKCQHVLIRQAAHQHADQIFRQIKQREVRAICSRKVSVRSSSYHQYLVKGAPRAMSRGWHHDTRMWHCDTCHQKVSRGKARLFKSEMILQGNLPVILDGYTTPRM